MPVRRDVFQAIADPTRREIIQILSQQTLNLNALSENFKVSRQAVSLHVKILQDCGLITIQKQGRERYCQAKLEQLHEVSEWVAQYRQHWEKRLDALEKYLTQLQKQKSMQKEENSTAAREMHLTRILEAPTELVWEVITDPTHVSQFQ